MYSTSPPGAETGVASTPAGSPSAAAGPGSEAVTKTEMIRAVGTRARELIAPDTTVGSGEVPSNAAQAAATAAPEGSSKRSATSLRMPSIASVAGER